MLRVHSCVIVGLYVATDTYVGDQKEENCEERDEKEGHVSARAGIMPPVQSRDCAKDNVREAFGTCFYWQHCQQSRSHYGKRGQSDETAGREVIDSSDGFGDAENI